jgi:hypothetical protein
MEHKQGLTVVEVGITAQTFAFTTKTKTLVARLKHFLTLNKLLKQKF